MDEKLRASKRLWETGQINDEEYFTLLVRNGKLLPLGKPRGMRLSQYLKKQGYVVIEDHPSMLEEPEVVFFQSMKVGLKPSKSVPWCSHRHKTAKLAWHCAVLRERKRITEAFKKKMKKGK